MRKVWMALALLCLVSFWGKGQTTLPFEIVNNSPDFTDDQVYVGLVGQYTGMGGVYIDFKANDVNAPALIKIDETLNTLHKNVGDWGYAPMFTKLSDIKNKTVHLPKVFGCRLFFAFKSPMYIHFFNSGGYAGPDLQNSGDPNNGIRWELIETTWADNGVWVNTTRVDSYQYPMGVELWGKAGSNNAYLKAGELLSHQTIVQQFQTQLQGTEFAPCYNTTPFSGDPLGGIIEQPSKIAQFKDTGVSKDYFQNYIDRIWAYFATNELVVKAGNTELYRGTVQNGIFKVKKPNGVEAWINGKPNTQEVIEGKGKIAEEVAATPDKDADLAFQAQFCAAISRGAIDLTVPSGQAQDWSNSAKYFGSETHNKYVEFFHQVNISYNTKTYAFAYDDVYDQSSTLVTSIPDRVKITIGGFYNAAVTPPGPLASITITPATTSMVTGASQTFIATGQDANGTVVATTPTWSATGGTIDQGGKFSASSAGSYTVTATVGAIHGSAQVSVQANEGAGGCLLTTSSNDFTVAVSTDKSNPTFTFIPGVNGKGTPICNLFYTTAANPVWNQVGANIVTPNTPFKITASEGQTVHYFYTYTLASGGEQNSQASNDTYVVGSCAGTNLNEDAANSNVLVYPNPVSNILNIEFGSAVFNQLSLVNISGNTVYDVNISEEQTEAQINIESLPSGVYSLVLRGYSTIRVLKIIKR